MVNRLLKLRQELSRRELDALLISQPENRRYISGFTGSAGFLVITQDKAILATDFRYIQQAKEQSLNYEIIRTFGDIKQWLPEIILSLNIGNLGFESRYITYASFLQLREAIVETGKNIKLLPTDTIVEALRAVKDTGEAELIFKAVNLADKALDFILSLIHPGMTEKQAAWQIERFLRENNSESVPFEIIVAAGPHSAMPHAEPSDRGFLPDEPILFDIGAKVGGYCSDISRTTCLCSESNAKYSQIYNIVLEAQLAAIRNIYSGMNVKEADNIARAIIKQHGYGDYFGHSLGHGIGLATHENPILGPLSNDILTDNMIFTIEPGIYLNDWGGVRIEDTVMLKKGRVEVLNRTDKMSGYVNKGKS